MQQVRIGRGRIAAVQAVDVEGSGAEGFQLPVRKAQTRPARTEHAAVRSPCEVELGLKHTVGHTGARALCQMGERQIRIGQRARREAEYRGYAVALRLSETIGSRHTRDREETPAGAIVL